MPRRFGFGKRERLKSRKKIEELFMVGKSFPVFPLRVTYQFLPGQDALVRAGVTVSKKYFKRAVDRNRIKRLMREAYRLEKLPLTEAAKQKGSDGFLFFMYTDKVIAPLDTIRTAMRTAISRLIQNMRESHEDFS